MIGRSSWPVSNASSRSGGPWPRHSSPSPLGDGHRAPPSHRSIAGIVRRRLVPGHRSRLPRRWDAVEVARRAVGRVIHVHLKDVDAEAAARVRSGEVPFRQAVIDGMFVPLGRGAVDIAGVVRELEANGYRGWYVLEQDVSLSAIPSREAAPRPMPSRASNSCAVSQRFSLTGVSHPVWFERPVPTEFADEIGPRIEVFGPGTGSDPFFGIESAAGVIASVLRLRRTCHGSSLTSRGDRPDRDRLRPGRRRRRH